MLLLAILTIKLAFFCIDVIINITDTVKNRDSGRVTGKHEGEKDGPKT